MRTNLELQGLAAGLAVSKGAAPIWLHAQLEARTAQGLAFGPREVRSLTMAGLSTMSLFAALVMSLSFDVVPAAAVTRAPRQAPAAAPDLDAQDAVALVQEWKIAGDETPVLERLGESVARAAGPRAWTSEKTGPDAYLVVFRERNGPLYAFEVDLAAEEVHATPETVDLLTLRRVRDESVAAHGLLAAR
jgi:hypothetical protein